MTLALLTIGTELTRGELQNGNSTWLAERLSLMGYEVTELVTVDDDDERIMAALARLSSAHEAILCTGGLGPTTDDRTTACVARLLEVPLERDSVSLEIIRSLVESRGRSMAPSNEKQADFPRGATVMPNSRGTAPGFYVDLSAACRAFFMPGVPAEMHEMFERHVLPALPRVQTPVVTVRLRTFGMPESEVNDRLVGLEEEHGVTLGYRASHSEIEVKVLATARPGEPTSSLEERAESVAQLVEERLGRVVYGRGSARLPEVIGELLAARGQWLGLAESCTGGLVAEMLTQTPGASGYFAGGIVSYANQVKEQVLGVHRDTLLRHGAVSAEVAIEMARGALRILEVDYALAFTGVAGPGGGTEAKPVGLVHWAIAHRAGVETKSRTFFGTRSQVQRRAALSGLWSLRQLLLDDPEH